MARKKGGECVAARVLLAAALAGGAPVVAAHAQVSPPPTPQQQQMTPEALQKMLQSMRSGMAGGAAGAGMLPRPIAMPAVPATPGQSTAGVATKPSPAVPAQPGTAGAYAGTRPSLLDEPAKPAGIDLRSDQLTVTANNASLSDTLQEVARRTGMQIEGANHDQRIFGTYGPASTADVLTALLDDSGYNVMMVGSGSGGAPRRLVLSARTAAPTGQAAAANLMASRDEDEDEAPQPQEQPGQPAAMGGAPGMHSPQQMLEDLQRMRGGNNGQPGGEEQPQQPAVSGAPPAAPQ